MTRLTTEQRHELPNRAFAYIDQEGNRHLPIENAEHVRDALSRWPLTQFESEAAKEEARKKILAAAKRFGIQVSPTDKIARNEHD
jgi:hypothetical protein